MQGLFPHSEEFMFWDPEHIEDYQEWQRFAEFLASEDKIASRLQQARAKESNLPHKSVRLSGGS